MRARTVDFDDAVQHGFLLMQTVIRAVVALAAAAIVALPPAAAAGQSAADLTSQAMQECDQGQDATSRDARKEHFERGEALAAKAVALDDKSAPAHFAVVCNLGEMLRVDGEKITSVLSLRRLLGELDRTLQLDPKHVDAMSTKGSLLVRLPRVFGGNPEEGERLLREAIRLDDSVVMARINLAKSCEARGDREEAIQFASRALEIAKEQGRADKVAEAQSTLDGLGAATR